MVFWFMFSFYFTEQNVSSAAETLKMFDMSGSLQVIYQLRAPDCSLASMLSSCSMFQKEIAMATCSALAPHLSVLTAGGINSLWLRISTQADMVKTQTQRLEGLAKMFDMRKMSKDQKHLFTLELF